MTCTCTVCRCTRFQREEELQKLVGQLVDELSGCGSLETKSQLRDVFELLPPPSQKTVLIGTAGGRSLY